MRFSFKLMCVLSLAIWAANALPAWAELPEVDTLPDRDGLPEALVMEDGTKVTTAEQWYKKRRPELKQLFQQEMFGFLPPEPVKLSYQQSEKSLVADGRGQLHEFQLTLIKTDGQVQHALLAVVLPVEATKPVPVFLALNKCGNQEILPDQAITFQDKQWRHSGCQAATRGEKTDYWCVASLLKRGYGFATAHVADFEPDTPTEMTNAKESTAASTLTQWAWGLHRCVDVLSQFDAVDSKKICVIGHSRRGKAALWAAAMDERIALVVPHQSGTGGMALSRDNDQETVTRITTVFPHWFSKRFTEYAGKEQKLPIDQHLLVALVAPRPLMETSGIQDTWANYEHSLKAIKAASEVYEFLGVSGIKDEGMLLGPQKLTPEMVGRLVQYRLDTKHVLTQQYWDAILDYADIQLGN